MNKLVRICFILLVSIMITITSYSQAVGINTDSIHGSAVLQIESDSAGVLIPRLDSSTISAIADPAISLLVYQKNGNEGYRYFDGERWKPLSEKAIEYQFINPDSIEYDKVDSLIYSQNLEGNHFYHYDSIGTNKGVWFWNGEEILPLNSDLGEGLKVYSSYTDLREDSSGVYPATVVVENFTTIYDNEEYTVVGGIFTKSSTGSEDGGVTIVNSSGIIYSRMWDGTNVYTDWWEIGGFDHTGKQYQDDNKLEGIQNSGDRVWSAVEFSSEGTNIVFGGEEYITSKTLYMKDLQQLKGNGSTLKRLGVQTTLTSDFNSGSNTLQVVDASSFRIGMEINAFGSQTYNDQSRSGASNSHTITDISGNTITVAENAAKTIDSGSIVCITDEMIRANDRQNVISNLTIDGNVQEVNGTYSWKHLEGVVAFSGGAVANGDPKHGITLSNCNLINIASEAILAGSPLWIDKCNFENIYGSAVHGSDANISSYSKAGVFITDCKFYDICKATAAENGHAAQMGLYSQSIGTGNIVISNCYAEMGNNGGIVTPLSSNSDNTKIVNSVFREFDHIMNNISLGSNNLEGFVLSNNSFYNCGVMNFTASANSSNVFSDVKIVNNSFVNSQFVLLATNGLTFTGNNIKLEQNSTFVDFATSKLSFPNSNRACLYVSADNAMISNNTFEGSYYDLRARNAIEVNIRTTSALVSSSIQSNTIVGFNRGIDNNISGQNVYRKALEVSNNIIELEEYGVGACFGILSGYGASVMGNRIYNPSPSTYSIRFYGTNTDAPADNRIGGVIKGNIIEGSTFAEMIRVTYRNVLVMDNVITGNFDFDNGKSNNIVGENWQIDVINRTLTLIPGN